MKTIAEMNTEERVSLKRKAIVYDNVARWIEAILLCGLVFVISGFAGSITR
jgi:hypothetical protein